MTTAVLLEASPAAKARGDAAYLRQQLDWAVRTQYRLMTYAQESQWYVEIERIVLYYLEPDDPAYLELKGAPDRNQFGGPLRFADFGDDDLAERQRETLEPNRRVLVRLGPLERCIKLIEEQAKTLPDKPMGVVEKRQQRNQVIQAMYRVTEGRIAEVPLELISERANLHPTLVRDRIRDLVQSGHVTNHADHHYALTVAGRDLAEESEAPTTKSAANYTNQFLGPVNVVQQGDHNTATATQQVNAGPQEYVALLDRLKEAAASLPEAQREPLLVYEEDLRTELSKKEPNWTKVAAYFQAAAQIVSAVKESAPVVYDLFHRLVALVGPSIQQYFP